MNNCKSFLKPKTCGFHRTAAFFVVSHSNSLRGRYEDYSLMFNENVEYVSFISSANRLKTLFQKWGKRKSGEPGERLKYIETFHPREYQKLSSNGQREHSLFDCKGCEN